MKKVNWRWDLGVYVPFCPHCDEPAYEKKKCVFCGKKYKWAKPEIKSAEYTFGDYTVVQAMNNHITVYKDGRMALHSSCKVKMTKEELKEQVEFVKRIRGDT